MALSAAGTGLVEAVLPERLGRDFRWLWSGFTVANVADGILLSAGPLLVTSVTFAPLAVAMAVFVQRLPWLLFGVVAGAVIDRTDRRRLLVLVDVCRAVVLLALAVAIANDQLSLGVIYAAMFVIGTAETFADNAGTAIVADVVPVSVLGLANSRLLGSHVVTNQLAGPPIGAFLFGLGHAVPFGANAVCFALAAALVVRMRPVPAPVREGPTTLVADVVAGVRWLWAHRPIRTLAVLITVFNVTFGAAFSIWVLYALERLGLSEFGFGLLMAASAVGGLVGSAAFAWLEARYSYALLLRIGLLIETLSHLGLALTTSPVVAGAVMTLFGVHAVTWGSLSNTIRHRAVPSHLLGRVSSVYNIGSIGALSVGAVIGGVMAQRWGVLAPFWFASAGAGITTAVVWGSISNVAEAGAPRRSRDVRP